ncbi:MAG: BLUF domain-containing protein [Burkholderiales bacterium]|nr:BLUF domain-containing protein [Burkholderiales bacterium]
MGLQPLPTAIEGLLYRSRIVNRIGPLHMFLLVERARLANQAEGITGQLIYLDHSFMEYLEGPTAALDALWRNLRQDPRHYDVELLARFPLAQRRCASWPLMFSSNSYFQQYQMTGFSTVQPGDMDALLEDCLSRQQAAVAGQSSALVEHLERRGERSQRLSDNPVYKIEGIAGLSTARIDAVDFPLVAPAPSAR